MYKVLIIHEDTIPYLIFFARIFHFYEIKWARLIADNTDVITVTRLAFCATQISFLKTVAIFFMS